MNNKRKYNVNVSGGWINDSEIQYVRSLTTAEHEKIFRLNPEFVITDLVVIRNSGFTSPLSQALAEQIGLERGLFVQAENKMKPYQYV